MNDLRPPHEASLLGLPSRVQVHSDDARTVTHIHDAWRVGNRWWLGETPSLHLLVDMEGGVSAEIYREERSAPEPLPQGLGWRIERLLD